MGNRQAAENRRLTLGLDNFQGLLTKFYSPGVSHDNDEKGFSNIWSEITTEHSIFHLSVTQFLAYKIGQI